MPRNANSPRKKVIVQVEKELTKEVKEKKKKKSGFKLVKAESAGKLAIRTEESVYFKTRKEALDYAKQGGRLTVSRETLDELKEGNYKTVECWKVQPSNSESYYWFVECI
jgi:hypothetical protein